jgi:hypothetical protein
MDSFIRIVPQIWENRSLENPLTLTLIDWSKRLMKYRCVCFS